MFPPIVWFWMWVAGGYIDKELCHIIGIEIDEEDADKAKNYCEQVIIADVEEIEKLPFPNYSFDVIIYSDILEHLKRPDLVLLNLKKYLKRPEGFIIASIPNIERLEFRIRHFLGQFDYKESGILSKGHLRFFTLKTAKRLFEIIYGLQNC